MGVSLRYRGRQKDRRFHASKWMIYSRWRRKASRNWSFTSVRQSPACKFDHRRDRKTTAVQTGASQPMKSKDLIMRVFTPCFGLFLLFALGPALFPAVA